MPFFYDLNRVSTSSGSANTEVTNLWAKTAANQETLGVFGVFFTGRLTSAGGCTGRVKDNTGTTASGGTGQTPAPRNRRGNPAAQSTWANDATTITPGATLVQRMAVGFAATGGQGGYVPIKNEAALQMMPNATNPVDIEFTNICAQASVPFDLAVDFGEGI